MLLIEALARRVTSPENLTEQIDALVALKELLDGMTTTRATHAAAIQARAAQYLQKINELDARTKDRLQAIPPDQRRLITSHDAFGYLAD